MEQPASLRHPSLGQLTLDEGMGWWEAEGVPVPMFGDKTIVITIQPDDENGPIAPDLFAAVEAMLALGPAALNEITPHVWANYDEFRDAVGEEDVFEIDPTADIWFFVHPGNAAVERRDGDIYVSFECNCEWEIEHGLMLVLKDGKRWVKVSDYDGHVTDGHAFAKPLLDEWIKDPDATLPIRTLEEIIATPGGLED